MEEREVDGRLTEVLQQGLGVTREREEAMWGELAARRALELAAWSAFVGAVVRMSRNLLPAMQACAWPGPFYRE